jgi:GNAT superfamily N-acetyltransferase
MAMSVLGAVTLERALKEDAEELANISKRSFHSDVEVGAPNKEGGPPGYDSPEFQINMMKWCDYHKILCSGQIVGGLIVARKRNDHYEVARVFVDPEHHNRGIATKVFQTMWPLYPEANLWTLGTPEWNMRTKHFYEKLGFVQIGWTMEELEWRGRFYQKKMKLEQLYALLKITDLREGMKEVELEAEVLEKLEPRQVRSNKTGETLNVVNAVIADETGTITLVLWNEQIGQANIGDKIRIESAHVTVFRGEKQLNLNRFSPIIVLL